MHRNQVVLLLKRQTWSDVRKEKLFVFSTTVLRGDRIGLIGPNEFGKVPDKTLLGQVKQSSGTAKPGLI